MSDWIGLIGAALIGLLVPSTAQWLRQKIEEKLDGNRAEMTTLISSLADGVGQLVTRMNVAELDIAFLKGVAAERAVNAQSHEATAAAVAQAVALAAAETAKQVLAAASDKARLEQPR